MFRKLVAIEPTSLIPSAEKKLHAFAKEVILYPDIPKDDQEIAARIGDADAVLLSYTSRLGKKALEQCPDVKYIGMCCSLYSPESANVDIRYADSRGITVIGIRDYGDEGVVEYVVIRASSLIAAGDAASTRKLGFKASNSSSEVQALHPLPCFFILAARRSALAAVLE